MISLVFIKPGWGHNDKMRIKLVWGQIYGILFCKEQELNHCGRPQSTRETKTGGESLE